MNLHIKWGFLHNISCILYYIMIKILFQRMLSEIAEMTSRLHDKLDPSPASPFFTL